MAIRSRPNRRLTVAQQAARLRSRYPSFRIRCHRGRLLCKAMIQPLDICEIYTVRVEYQLGGLPAVKVVSPALQKRPDGTRCPHLYADDEPCLYRPVRKDWDASRPIADFIIPWLSLWLFYYEIWLTTGAWLGGGEHPHATEQVKASKRRVLA